jgi:hypothetical protein
MYTAPHVVSLKLQSPGTSTVLRSFVGLYSSPPAPDRDDDSSCRWDSRFLKLSLLPNSKNRGTNESSYLLYVIRSSSQLASDDILELHIPPFIHTRCGSTVNVSSVGAGTFMKEENSNVRMVRLRVKQKVPPGHTVVLMVSEHGMVQALGRQLESYNFIYCNSWCYYQCSSCSKCVK